ncbi:hypothetical protein M407DRAFT_27801 [Tulasnella calospora MUT 4182]|uniref:Uncharacterized protein n=1 Tax=Tulasnella calospora MUT 4182 TaxID=1051891 RepID=A0A0C3LMX3_9AGAM|nr:hypothetical protein M407DRAFT_27801 [Tulasnella calospora MUT 4182]
MLATFEIGVVWNILNGGVGPREPSPDPALRSTMSEDRLRTQPSNSSLSTKTYYVAQEKDQQQPPSYTTPPDTPQIARVGRKEKPFSKSKEPQPTKSSLSLSAAVNGLAHWTSFSPHHEPSKLSGLLSSAGHPTFDPGAVHHQAPF